MKGCHLEFCCFTQNELANFGLAAKSGGAKTKD